MNSIIIIIYLKLNTCIAFIHNVLLMKLQWCTCTRTQWFILPCVLRILLITFVKYPWFLLSGSQVCINRTYMFPVSISIATLFGTLCLFLISLNKVIIYWQQLWQHTKWQYLLIIDYKFWTIEFEFWPIDFYRTGTLYPFKQFSKWITAY